MDLCARTYLYDFMIVVNYTKPLSCKIRKHNWISIIGRLVLVMEDILVCMYVCVCMCVREEE